MMFDRVGRIWEDSRSSTSLGADGRFADGDHADSIFL